MQPFRYARTADPDTAIATVAQEPRAAFIAGGTELLNLMRDGVQSPTLLVDINAVPLARVEAGAGGVHIGALARMSDVARADVIRTGYPVLAEALLAAASPQVRNMATIGGNLMQRTRCWYFRDPAFPCNRRLPGSGCSALHGENRWHSILGGSESCIAVHPSDPAVALLALDAVVLTQGRQGQRRILIDDFYLLPGTTPHRETVLSHGEMIVGVDLPATRFARRSQYLKVRDRAAFEFALVSVAAAIDVEGGVVREARVALGGVAPRPWRARGAEDALLGRRLSQATIAAAASAAVRGAVPREHNAFKVGLAQRALTRVLSRLGGRT